MFGWLASVLAIILLTSGVSGCCNERQPSSSSKTIVNSENLSSSSAAISQEDYAAPQKALPPISTSAVTGDMRYIVEFELYQSHFTLDIGEHLKDAMNTAKFEVPVDKEYYDHLQIGTKINDNFRWGSLLLRGSLGSWNIKVTNKRIEYHAPTADAGGWQEPPSLSPRFASLRMEEAGVPPAGLVPLAETENGAHKLYFLEHRGSHIFWSVSGYNYGSSVSAR